MDFQADALIQDNRGEMRWRVVGLREQLQNLKVWEVADQSPGMERLLVLMTLDYGQLPVHDRDFAIQQLRDSFQGVTRILGEGSYNFLPEPVDYITFSNHLDPMNPDLRRDEPGLVLTQNNGMRLRSPMDRKGQLEIHKLRGSINSTLKTIKNLHQHGVVIQALPSARILINPITYQPYFTGIHSLIRMADFNGFNPNRASLAPTDIFSAPESFDPRGRLTPATDIYALGKLALQLLLGGRYEQHFTREQPFPADIQAIINALNLPEPWPRFLAMCLQPDPAQRFQNATEAEIFLMPQAKQDEIARRRSIQPPQEQRSADSSKTSPVQSAQNSKQPSAQSKDGLAAAGHIKKPWMYRENPQLPDAMLLIWGERLTTKKQFLNFGQMYGDFMYTYNLKPRLFFRTYRAGAVSDNTFFVMLQDQFMLTVTPLDGRQDPIGILNHALDPHLATIRNLILVGGADEAGVQCILQHPNAVDWRIHWVRGAGNWNPSIRVESVTDMTKYLRTKVI